MISVKTHGEWDELDTLNNYYRLDDLWNLKGKPEGLEPITWMRNNSHKIGSVQVRTVKRAWEIKRTNVWASQPKLMEYSAFLCPDFRNHYTAAIDLLEQGNDIDAYHEIRKVMSGVYSL